MTRVRDRGGVVLTGVVLLLVIGAVFAVNAISGRQSLADSRDERAASLTADANLLAAQIPDSYRDDKDLLDSATFSSVDTNQVLDELRPNVESLGLELVEPNDGLAAELASEVVASIDLDAAPGDPTLEAVVRVVAVRGDIHAIAALLEVVERGTKLLVLSAVEYRFDTSGATATFALAGAHLVADTPEQRLARLASARSASEASE